MNTTTTTNEKNENGSRIDPMAADELEFRKTLPVGQWLLVELEQPKQLSTHLQGFEVRSPFAVVIGVGPEFRADMVPGDRVTYAECLNLPKELAGVRWAGKYKWMHENKVLGRLPRAGETKMASEPATALDKFFGRLDKMLDGPLIGLLAKAVMSKIGK